VRSESIAGLTNVRAVVAGPARFGSTLLGVAGGLAEV
jgi:hypothetical protein